MTEGRAVRAAPARVLLVGGREVELRVRRSARARRLRLVVRPAEPLEVVLPRRAVLADVEPFLVLNRRWLEDKIRWATELSELPPALDVSRPNVLWVRGEPIPVIRRPVARPGASLVGGRVVVSGPEPASAIDRWYRREARAALTAAAEAVRMGLPYRSISVRDPRTRWGSCSHRGDLSFSWRLILAPARVLNHVVTHEMCHLRHPNHGPKFRRALDDAEPDWREPDRWLSDHGHELRRYTPLLPGD